MPLNSKSIQDKIRNGLSKAGVSMILRKTLSDQYDPATSQAVSINVDLAIVGMVFDLSSQEKQTLGGTFSEQKKIAFAFEEGGKPEINDIILVGTKTYTITEVKNTLPLVGEDLMYQVIVKL